jgi:hypothetical protein
MHRVAWLTEPALRPVRGGSFAVSRSVTVFAAVGTVFAEFSSHPGLASGLLPGFAESSGATAVGSTVPGQTIPLWAKRGFGFLSWPKNFDFTLEEIGSPFSKAQQSTPS